VAAVAAEAEEAEDLAPAHAATPDRREPEVVTSLFARIRADAEAFVPVEPVPVPADEVADEPLPVAAAADEVLDAPALPLEDAAPAPAADVPALTVAQVIALPVSGAPALDDEVLDRRARALAGPERGLGRVLKRALSEEQNELLDAVRRAKDIPTLDALLGTEDAHALRYATAARGELRDAAYAGAHLLDATAGGAERPDADDLAAQLGFDIVGPLRERLEGCWSDAGANEHELVELVRGTYRQWRNKVLPALTHQYVALGFNRGLTAASGADAAPWLVDASS
jgi:hypothetical protein